MADQAASVTAGPADDDVRLRLNRIDGLLEQLEADSGPAADTAMAAIEELAEVYGAAIARMAALASGNPRLIAAFDGDELLHDLMLLHGAHPQQVAERVGHALDEVRPYIRSHGGDIELAAIDCGVALVRISTSYSGIGPSIAALERAVTAAVLAAAPELTGVQRVGDSGDGYAAVQPNSATLVPPESLEKSAPLTAQGTAPTN